jgi:hypothetical protein
MYIIFTILLTFCLKIFKLQIVLLGGGIPHLYELNVEGVRIKVNSNNRNRNLKTPLNYDYDYDVLRIY